MTDVAFCDLQQVAELHQLHALQGVNLPTGLPILVSSLTAQMMANRK